MIRYRIRKRELLNQIDAKDDEWRTEAATATKQLKRAQAYSAIGPEWGKIKPVFMALQHNKCGFCERLLPAEEFGRREHDVEHFRPKNLVVSWLRTDGSETNISFETGQGSDAGYYWLAYDPLNYLTSCKACNSDLKGNYFPIAKPRETEPISVSKLMRVEAPYLVYPITSMDDDPEKILGFNGVVAITRASRGHRRKRGQVIIELFALNRRPDLIEQRSIVIDAIYANLRDRESEQPEVRTAAVERLSQLLADNTPHANCARSYVALFDKDPLMAWRVREAARNIIADVRRNRNEEFA